MRFDIWVNEQIEQSNPKQTKRTFLEAFAERAGVSYMTVQPAANGMRMGLYAKAQAVSRATGWKVSVPELCDPRITPEQIREQYQALAGVLSHA